MKAITPQEILEGAQSDKIGLIDKLAARLWEVGADYSVAAAKYYGEGARNAPPGVSAEYHRLEILYDDLKHIVSALQSTLRAEREIGGLHQEGA